LKRKTPNSFCSEESIKNSNEHEEQEENRQEDNSSASKKDKSFVKRIVSIWKILLKFLQVIKYYFLFIQFIQSTPINSSLRVSFYPINISFLTVSIYVAFLLQNFLFISFFAKTKLFQLQSILCNKFISSWNFLSLQLSLWNSPPPLPLPQKINSSNYSSPTKVNSSNYLKLPKLIIKV